MRGIEGNVLRIDFGVEGVLAFGNCYEHTYRDD